MISNDIQELLKNITKSLIKIETKELDALISRQLTHIDNIDFHRYEISHRKIESLKFSFWHFPVHVSLSDNATIPVTLVSLFSLPQP